MNFNPLAQFGGGFESDEDDSPQPIMLSAPAANNNPSLAIPIMNPNGRMIRVGLDDESELESETDADSDAVPEPVQFTVKHLRQQRQSVLAFNAGGPNATGIQDPKLNNEIIALNQKIQSLQILLDKSRNKARQQAVDLEDAEDRVGQLEQEVQQLNDSIRQRDHAISNLEYELQRAQKKDDIVGVQEKAGFSDKLKLFQNKIAASTLETNRRPPLRGHPTLQRTSSNVGGRTGSICMNEAQSQEHASPRLSQTFLPTPPPPPPIPSAPVDTPVAPLSAPSQSDNATAEDSERIKDLEKKVRDLQQSVKDKESEFLDLQHTLQSTENAYVMMNDEMQTYQNQVVSLQQQCSELEAMYKQQQDVVQSERQALKDAKDEWSNEESRLLEMIDDLHSTISQTSITIREYQEQIQLLQSNQRQQPPPPPLSQSAPSTPRGTVSLPLPPTPASPTVLSPVQEDSQIQSATPSVTGDPAPLKVSVAADSSDDDAEAAPPAPPPKRNSTMSRPSVTLTPRSAQAVNPFGAPQPPTPSNKAGAEPPVIPTLAPTQEQPQSQPQEQSQPSQQQQQQQEQSPASEVYAENSEDGQLITKGLLTKLGLDQENKPSSKRHFFALFSTHTQYSDYYGDHVKVACELRWGKQESDYTTYPYGATITNAYVGPQAIQYLRNQGQNGQTLSQMVRPEDISRLLVMSTVDGRYVLVMCRDSERGGASGADRALAWTESVRAAIRSNAKALGYNADEIFQQYDEDFDDESSTPGTPVFSSSTLPMQLLAPEQLLASVQQQSTQLDTPIKAQPPPTPPQAQQRISTFSPLPTQLSSPNTSGTSSAGAQTPSIGPAPTPGHFMTRPATSIASPSVPVVAPATPSTITTPMRGTLTKFVHNGKGWHTKHFFLTSTSGVIQWGDSPNKYKYHEFVKSVLRGQDKDLRLDLKAIKKSNLHYNPDLMFSVQTTGKTLYLMAPTDESLTEWIEALERAIHSQHGAK